MGFDVTGELFEESVESTVIGVVDLVVVMLSMSGLAESVSDEPVVSTLVCKYYLIKSVLLTIRGAFLSIYFQIHYLGSPYLDTVHS